MNYNLPLNCSEIITDEHFELLNHESTCSVYFAGIQLLPEARNQNFSEHELSIALSNIRPDIKKNLLLNGIMSNPFLYRDKGQEIMLVENFILELQEQKLLNGLIVYDMYLLKLLALRGNVDLKSLDIIPSINCMLDSVQRINAIIYQLSSIVDYDYIPPRLCLDRSLNRNHKQLVEVSEYVRLHFPDTELELIANEGCMYQCHIKNTHDSCICLGSMLDVPTSNLVSYAHNTYGCVPLHRKEEFNYILASPFLRPEDIKEVESLVDTIKISGRRLSFPTLKRVIEAYRSGEKLYINLVEVLEAVMGLKDDLFIFSDLFPKDFYSVVSNCDKKCSKCDYCKEVLKQCSQLLK